MIKINFPDTKEFKDLLLKFKEKAIQTIGNDNAKNVEQAFYNFLNEKYSFKNKTNRNKIKLYTKQISSYKNEVNNLFLIEDCSLLVNNDLNDYIKVLKKMFDENSISNKWSYFRTKVNDILFEIFHLIDIRVCPYCNRSFVPVIKYDEGKTLSPEMDHFYPKKEYPYLAFSFYNLVPICSTCNVRFKSSRVLNILHPYKEGFENNVRFKLEPKKQESIIDLLSGSYIDKDKFNIRLIKKKILPSDLDKQYITRCINSNKYLHISETYDKMHKIDAIELVRKISLFRPSYSRSFISIVNPKLSKLIGIKEDSSKQNYESNNSEILNNLNSNTIKLLFGNWLDESNDLKEPLSKFKRDIYQQFTTLQYSDYGPLENSN